MPEQEPLDPPPDERPLPAAVAVPVACLLTLLLSVWAAFLVPLRMGTTAVPVWLVPLGAMLALGTVTGRRYGLLGALAPAAVWLVSSPLSLGAKRAEGDLVVPASLGGLAYLYGGMLLWALVVLRASARAAVSADDRAPAASSGTRPAGTGATPVRRSRR